ncbi:RNA-binding protein [Galdieria sulphuraria]|uniref:RNA-binding protein n=1 Tax=Galdieria sulphuraria TaxID=130081 RepID=M2Y2S9_GALSU|nr:RNA-binding protein [Galdieria sulphuraria]EME30124.1 RNA-binding protein [Galdieria sulphuraria]|eukprot:XP_005706644.1 RNA-binding protein [Galdieria sulphuraria]
MEDERNSRLLIQGLPKYIAEKRLKDIFSSQGEVTDVKVLRKKDGTCRRFGFVGFKTVKQAKAAKDYFHETFIDTSRIQVEYAKPVGDQNLPRKRKPKLVENELPKRYREKEQERDPAFQEFLQVMKPRKKKAIWENDWSVDIFGKNNKETNNAGREERRLVASKKPGGEDVAYEQLHVRFDEEDNSSESSSYQQLEESVPDAQQEDSTSLSSVSSEKEEEKVENDQQEEYSNDEEWLESKLSKPIIPIEPMKKNDEMVEKEITLTENNDTKSENFSVENTKDSTNSNSSNVLETGRLFVRNLAYSVTDEELTKLFEKYGLLSDVHVCIDSETQKAKGFAFITFVLPENAAQAMAELDGHIFQGRLLHILPAMAPIRNEQERKTSNLYKDEKLAKMKQSAKLGTDRQAWSSLYMSTDAVADSIAQNFQVSKSQVYENLQDSGTAAVQLAIGEAHLQEETRQLFQSAGVNVDALNDSKDGPRSKTVILVKNLPATTLEKEVVDLFMKFGALRQVIMAPSCLIGLVEFIEANDAKRAYRALAYSKFKDRPLYLEWASQDIFLMKPSSDSNVMMIEEKQEEDEPSSNNLDRIGRTSLFVKNLDFNTTEDQLRRVFEKVAPVRSVTIAKKNKISASAPVSLGFGFVEYATEKDAQRALNQLQGTVIDGHAVVLKLSERSGGKKISEPKKVSDSVCNKLVFDYLVNWMALIVALVLSSF